MNVPRTIGHNDENQVAIVIVQFAEMAIERSHARHSTVHSMPFLVTWGKLGLARSIVKTTNLVDCECSHSTFFQNVIGTCSAGVVSSDSSPVLAPHSEIE